MRTFSECSPRACRVSVSGWGFVRGLLLRHYVLPYQRPRRDSVLAYHPAYVATLRQRLEHYNTQGSHYYPYQFHVYTISCGNLLWVVFEPLKVCLTPTMIRNVRGVVLYIWGPLLCLYCARFGSTYTKIGTIQRRLAWPLVQRWHAKSWSVPNFVPRCSFVFFRPFETLFTVFIVWWRKQALRVAVGYL